MRKDIIPTLKILSLTNFSRIISYIILIFLSNELPIEDMANWQIFRAISGYVLVCMEGGFLYQSNIFLNKFNYSINSILIPIFLIYSYLSNFSNTLIFSLIIFFLISIFDTNFINNSLGEAIFSSKLIFLKNITNLIFITFLIKYNKTVLTPIIGLILSTLLIFFLLYRKILNLSTFNKGIKLKINFLEIISKGKYFIITVLSLTSLQTADLLIGNIFLSKAEISLYGIALIIAEIPLSVPYAHVKSKFKDFANQKIKERVIKYSLISIIFPLLMIFIINVFPSLLYYFFPKYDTSQLISILSVLLIYSLARSANIYIQLYLKLNGSEKIVSISALTSALLNIFLNIFLIPKYGLFIMPLITVFSEIILICVQFTLQYAKKNHIISS